MTPPQHNKDVEATATESVSWLQAALAEARRGYRLRQGAIYLLLGGSVAVLALLAYGCADYLVGFPRLVRIVLTLGLAIAGGWRAWHTVQAMLKHLDSEEAIARAVETAQMARGESQRSLLISSLEFATHPGIAGSVDLKNASIRKAREACVNPARVPLHDERLLLRARRLALAGVPVAVLVLVFFHAEAGIFLLRALGANVPYPTATRIVTSAWPRVAPARQDYPVAVLAAGRLPASGTLTLQYKGERAFELGLVQDKDQPSNYLAVVTSPLDSFRFRVRVGDGETDWQDVDVRIPPHVVTGHIRITPPSYTGRPVLTQSLGDIKVSEGSTVEVSFQPSAPLSSQALVLQETNAIPGQAQGEGWYHVRFEARQSLPFHLRLVDADGLANDQALRFTLTVEPDQLPAVQLASPAPGTVLSPLSQLRFQVEAKDDFGLRDLAIEYAILRTEERGGAREDKEVGKGVLALNEKGAAVDGHARLSRIVSEFPVRPGDRMNFVAVATDNRPAGDGAARSDVVTVSVVTPEELRSLLLQEQERIFALAGKLKTAEERQAEAIQAWLKDNP